MNLADISKRLTAPIGLILIFSCFKGETIQIIQDGNERIEIVSRATSTPGSAQVFLIHFRADGSKQTIGLHGFDTEAHHEVATCEFNRESQSAKVTTSAGSRWLVDLKSGTATLQLPENAHDHHHPNPQLNSDPACIASRSLSTSRYLGSAQCLGAGGAG